jgi:hypothetical protein
MGRNSLSAALGAALLITVGTATKVHAETITLACEVTAMANNRGVSLDPSQFPSSFTHESYVIDLTAKTVNGSPAGDLMATPDTISWNTYFSDNVTQASTTTVNRITGILWRRNSVDQGYFNELCKPGQRQF